MNRYLCRLCITLVATAGASLPEIVWAEEPPASAQPVAVESSQDLPTIPVETVSETPAPVPPVAPKNSGIEEIVVTAQKREERLQDVPIAITAFTGDQLEASGVKTMADLAMKTPGLVFDTLINYSVIFIRGVGTDAFIPSADLSVAPYIDGVYFPISFGLARSLGEVERVEVLKGPQGTLFGRNSTGGAISITTKDPSETFRVSLSTSYGRYNENNNRLFVTGPLTDTLSASGGLIYNTKNDYYDTVAPNPYDKLQPYRDIGANGKLKWLPSETVDAVLNGYYFKSRGVGTSLLPCIKPSTLGTALNIECAPDYQTNTNFINEAYSEFKAGSLTINIHPGPLEIKSISAYQDTNGQSRVDFDGSGANLVGFGAPHDEKTLFGKIFTQELQFISNGDTPGADLFNWVGGLYYLDSTVGYDPVHFYLAGLDEGLAGVGSGNLPLPINLGLDGALDGLTSLLSQFDPQANLANLSATVTGSLDTKSYAAFLQGTLTPTDWLDITLGGRFQKEKRTVYNTDLAVDATLLGAPVQPTLIPYASQSIDKSNFSPKATISVKPAKDLLFYVSYQRAFKSGSFNIVNLTAPPTTIKPETVTSYEIGGKTLLFDRHVQVNGALFHTKIDDLQSQFVSLLSGGIVQFQNAPKATVKGAEVDVQWAIATGLRFNIGATYLNGRYKDFSNANGYNDAGFFVPGENGEPESDYSGNHIVRNPRFTGTTGLSYSYALSDGALDFGTDFYYNSGYFYDAQNTLKQQSYHLLNATLGYFYTPWNMSFTAFGANLENTRYYLYQFQTDFSTVGKLASPRTYGLRLNWSF